MADTNIMLLSVAQQRLYVDAIFAMAVLDGFELVGTGDRLVDVVLAEHLFTNFEALFEQFGLAHDRPFPVLRDSSWKLFGATPMVAAVTAAAWRRRPPHQAARLHR